MKFFVFIPVQWNETRGEQYPNSPQLLFQPSNPVNPFQQKQRLVWGLRFISFLSFPKPLHNYQNQWIFDKFSSILSSNILNAFQWNHFKSLLKICELTSRPTQKECSWEPHCFAAFVSAKWRAVMEATKDESSPPERRTPKGTSVISLLTTACKISHPTHKLFSRELSILRVVLQSFLSSHIFKGTP